MTVSAPTTLGQLLCGLRPELGLDAAALTPRLEAVYAAARWPDVALDAADFVRHLARHLPADADALEGLHVRDLYLACACARGLPEALAAFERAHGGEVARAFHRVQPAGVTADDAMQLVRERLFLATPGGEPRIAEYAGRGPLGVWLRVAATRLLFNLATRGPREQAVSGAWLTELADAAAEDPEVERMRGLYRAELGAAFTAAVTRLPWRDRLLLHQRFAEQLTQEELAERYGVHVNTVARWLGRAHEALGAAVRAELGARLGVDTGAVESILRLVHSRIDVTLGKLIAAD